MRLYVVVFGQLYYQKDTEDRVVFATGLQDAKMFSTAEYSEAREIAARVKGRVEGLRLEFDRPQTVTWK